MARMDDGSPYVERWTNRKLMAEARRLANLETFDCASTSLSTVLTGKDIRDETRLYRDTWLKPVLDEIERRFVKS